MSAPAFVPSPPARPYAPPAASRPAVAGGTPVREGKPYLVFQAPDIRDEDVAAVVECLRSRWIGTGPRTQEFERRFAAYKGVEHAVAVNSCTAALQLALVGLGIGPGDEVLTTAMTFCSTVIAIMHTGATPVLCDCDPRTFNIHPADVERRVTPRTRAVVVVHMAGRPCDTDAILAIATRHGLLVIEDCAHAVETVDAAGRPAGTIGDVGCFSFYTTKNVTTAEGGMLVTRDADLARRLRTLALHGMTRDAWQRFGSGGYRHYDVVEPGYKMNLTDLASALGLSQLARVDESWARRRAVWERYDAGLRDLPLDLPLAPEPGTRHAYHLYTPLVRLDELRVGRDEVLAAFHPEGIGVGVHYRAVHQLTHWAAGLGAGSLPAAESVGDRTISLPVASWMTDDDVDDVVHACSRILHHFAA